MSKVDKWNQDVLNAKGIKTQIYTHSVVRTIGDLKRARLSDGTVIERKEYIFTEQDGMVKCAPYELHFIYELPRRLKGWGLYCTCGSIAGVVGMRAYSKLASPTDTGKMVVCIRHTATKQNVGVGIHADGSSE